MNAPSTTRSVRAVAATITALLLVGVLPATAAQAAPLQVRIAAQDGGTAVQEADALVVDGTAPLDGRVQDGYVVAVGADGKDVDRRQLSTGARNGPPTRSTFARVDGETLDGRFVLDCPFAADTTECPVPPVRGVLLELTVDGVTGRSNEVPLDNVDPVIERHEVVAPNAVRAVFNEAVTAPDGDNPADFRVRLDGSDYAVTAVRAGSGACQPAGADRLTPATTCTRDLTLGRALPEDAVPEVLYTPALLRNGYTDSAGNTIDRGRSLDALVVDRVRPAVPRIDSVGGRAAGGTPPTASGSQTQPAVVVSGLTVGHDVRVLVEQPGAAALDSGWQSVTSTTQSVQAPSATDPQQPAVLTAQARDPEQNTSAETAKQPARADGAPNPVTYVLDAAPPVLVGARAGDPQDVVVVFSEAVAGSDNARDWTVTTPEGAQIVVVGVTGSGDRRTLDTLQPVPPGSTVSYRPGAGSTRYTDGAGNPLADGVVVLGAVDLPVLLDPTAPVLTRVPAYRVRGTAPAGADVLLYADQGDDGRPDGPPLQTRTLAAGQTAFAFDVELARNAATDLVVTARDRARDLESRPAPVARITHDDLPPSLSLTRPAGGEVYAGGSEQEARYSYADPHPGAVRVELLLGGQAVLLTPGAAPTGTFGYRVPRVSSDAARLRITARDGAGNEGAPVLSAPFVIDAVPPALLAATVDVRTVEVRLSEPGVTGSSTLLDWRVDGRPVSAAEQRTEGGITVVRLTLGTGEALTRDARPRVTYTPTVDSQQYRDRAGQPVLDREVTARDGILPTAPTVTAPLTPVLTREATQQVTGRADVGDAVELIDTRGVRLGGPVPVQADGTWSVAANLPADSVSDLRAQSVDPNSNRSAQAAPVARIEQDSTDPAVTVLEPRAGSRFALGERITVRWTSADRNLLDGQTLVQGSTDGGRTFTTLGERRPASGSLTWTLPGTATEQALVRVSTPDRAGRTGTGSSGTFAVGAAPASPSPSATPTVVPLPPLTIGTDGVTITPGKLSPVTVGGQPGTRIELQAYSRPNTRYSQVRTGVLDASGRAVFQVRPGTNTRLFARVTDQSGQGDSRTTVVIVETALSLTVVRNGRRDYTFQGRILPRRAGQLITLYRVQADGTRVLTSQLRTDATGTYRIRRRFTGSGRFGFLTRTGTTLTNAAGESNGGRARPTDIF